MDEGILHRLDVIKKASLDVKANIKDILERNDKIEIATVKVDAYAQDLYSLMQSMADAANPVLNEMGLSKEAITTDINDFVRILEDNGGEFYFASLNIDAKYNRNKHALENLDIWLSRLTDSINKIERYLESDTEEKELKELFALLDKTALSEKEKKELKTEFIRVLNKLNKN